jgi:hypothetical protein
MRAIELFVAMQTGKVVEIVETMGHMYRLRINGMVAEDGSGACWIVFATDTDYDEQIKLFIRTVDNGGKFVARYIPKMNVYKF